MGVCVDGSGRVASSASNALVGGFIVGIRFFGPNSLNDHGAAEVINDIFLFLLRK